MEINPEMIEIGKKWKKRYYKRWKNKTNKEKVENVATLIYSICFILTIKKKDLSMIIVENNSNQYAYSKEKLTIYQDKNKPSIISGLHELGHHIYGANEEEVIEWSEKLFEKIIN